MLTRAHFHDERKDDCVPIPARNSFFPKRGVSVICVHEQAYLAGGGNQLALRAYPTFAMRVKAGNDAMPKHWPGTLDSTNLGPLTPLPGLLQTSNRICAPCFLHMNSRTACQHCIHACVHFITLRYSMRQHITGQRRPVQL